MLSVWGLWLSFFVVCLNFDKFELLVYLYCIFKNCCQDFYLKLICVDFGCDCYYREEFIWFFDLRFEDLKFEIELFYFCVRLYFLKLVLMNLSMLV